MFLCSGVESQKGFYIESLKVTIYSLEEFVLLLTKKAYLLEDKFFDKAFSHFLDKECGHEELAYRLYDISQSEGFIAGVTYILKYVGYINEYAISQVVAMCKEGEGLSRLEKKKLEVDKIFREQKYIQALIEYYDIIEALPEYEKALRGKVFHNIGVVYCYMFQFIQAYECFKKAYEYSEDTDTMYQMLLSARNGFSEKEYLDIVTCSEEFYEISLKIEEHIEEFGGLFLKSDSYAEVEQLKEWLQYGSEEGFYIASGRIVRKFTDSYYKNYI